MSKQRVTLKEGQWFEYPLDSGIPHSGVKICEGKRTHYKVVQKISRMQAIALARWHGHPGIWYSVPASNGRRKDVRLVGDTAAWHGDDR